MNNLTGSGKRRPPPPRPLPAGRAILVWIACALAGWVVAVVVIYGVLRFGDPRLADDSRLKDIAPAAGDSKSR